MSIYSDLIRESIDLYDKVEIKTTPNYRAMLMLKQELNPFFDPDVVLVIIGKMKLDVAQEAIDDPDFPALVKAFGMLLVRMHDQMVKDLGRTNARTLMMNSAEQYSLELTPVQS